MSSETQMKSRRRSERVLISVPVELKGTNQDGQEISEPATAVVVSRHGALLRVVTQLKMGTTATVTHGFSREAAEFRVVWLGERQADGRWDVGVEILTVDEAFWGIRFPPSKP